MKEKTETKEGDWKEDFIEVIESIIATGEAVVDLDKRVTALEKEKK